MGCCCVHEIKEGRGKGGIIMGEGKSGTWSEIREKSVREGLKTTHRERR